MYAIETTQVNGVSVATTFPKRTPCGVNQWTVERRRYLGVLLGLFLLSGCLTTRQPVSQRAGGASFLVTVWASSKCVDAGDTLIVRATVVNESSETKAIELKDQPVFDADIGYNTSAGSTIIRWSDGKPLTPDLTRLVLGPGGSKTIEMQWVVLQPVPSGIGVSAHVVDDLRYVDHPITAFLSIDGPDSCPGPFGP